MITILSSIDKVFTLYKHVYYYLLQLQTLVEDAERFLKSNDSFRLPFIPTLSIAVLAFMTPKAPIENAAVPTATRSIFKEEVTQQLQAQTESQSVV